MGYKLDRRLKTCDVGISCNSNNNPYTLSTVVGDMTVPLIMSLLVRVIGYDDVRG